MAVRGKVVGSEEGGAILLAMGSDGIAYPLELDEATGRLLVNFDDSATITLTGDVALDTFGALDDSKETNPDAASATIPALLRGQLYESERALGDQYETVAASQTDQALGGTGAAGDYLKGLLIVPAAVGAGTVSIKDGSGSAINVFVTGTLADLKPFFIPLGLTSVDGAWKVTTGANVSVIASGNFTA